MNFLQLSKILSFGFFAVFLISTLGCDPFETNPGCGSHEPTPKLLPIVFVHGGAGSADQFSLQAQRFVTNGYPVSYISGFEYDTTMENNTVAQIMTALDAHIDSVLTKTGASKVDLLGHSMGTMMSQSYLSSSEERAAKVAHYVNIDGRERDELPGNVPTLAIWASMSGDGREITGADNVTLDSQTHVQSATSAEAFAQMYAFFTGNAPKTLSVQPEDANHIVLAGKLIMFASNLIPQGYSLDIYEVAPETGYRNSETPVFSQKILEDGTFAFRTAKAGKSYEFSAYLPSGDGIERHFYYEPFVRSNHLMRLKFSEENGTLASMVDTDAGQTNLTIVRDKELVGDAESYPDQALLVNDSLLINGEELCVQSSTPADSRTIGLYVFDLGADGQSHVSDSIDAFASIPFVGGVDLFIAAADPPDQTISIVLKGRQNDGLTQTINVPNRSSETDKISVQFNAY